MKNKIKRAIEILEDPAIINFQDRVIEVLNDYELEIGVWSINLSNSDTYRYSLERRRFILLYLEFKMLMRCD